MIDVSDLLLDPDFVQSVTMITRTSSVSSVGRNTLTETQSTITASVQAGNGETLKRNPESARLEDWITVYSKTIFTTDGTGRYTDIIVWNGRRYNVQLVTNWSNWGDGWTRVDCLLEGAGNG